jgi:Spy/CpxP family protein refolding chaperone
VTNIRSTSLGLLLTISGFASSEAVAFTQPPAPGSPPAAAAQGGGRGRGGGLPGATPEQTQAVMDMNAALAEQTAAVASARAELAAVTVAEVKNVAGIAAAVEKLRVAELALASKRAEEFAKLQAGPNKLNPEQVKALIAAGGNAGRGRGGRGGGM